MGKWYITKISNQISGKRRTYYLHRLRLCNGSNCCRIIQLLKNITLDCASIVKNLLTKTVAYNDIFTYFFRNTVYAIALCVYFQKNLLRKTVAYMTVFYISSRKNSLPHCFYLKPSSLRFETLKENVKSWMSRGYLHMQGVQKVLQIYHPLHLP